jgi:serine/threonine-protein kinase
MTATAVQVLDAVAFAGIGGAAHVAISSNGTLTYVGGSVASRARTLVSVNRQGRFESVIDAARPFREARFSPDGQRIAIGIEGTPRDLWTYDIKRRALSRFTLEPSESEFATWTPDGERIAFGALRPGKGRVLLWKKTDGSGPEETLATGQDHYHPASWSPDGRVLAYTNVSQTETNSDIWMLPLDTKVPQPFAKTRFNERSPRFSPDGRFVAYVSDESGRDQVYVQAYPGPGGKWQASNDGGTEPVWARNGRELFYWTGNKLMSVAVATSSTFSAAAPQVLFEGTFDRPLASFPNYDVSTDGEHFLMFKSAQPAILSQITVVLDWATQLARRVPSKP